ncbi:MAG: amidohydrolase family protein, partial [Deltaproteobacteria bacterium]|nr:amidohydrolase family protein [Deltaproteobacteria bacterium]
NAPCVLEMATRGGAKAVGLKQLVGCLEIGKEADIIILHSHRPHLIPMYNPVSHLVYAAAGADVRDVIVSGNIVVKNRKILTIDLEDVMSRVRNLAMEIGK